MRTKSNPTQSFSWTGVIIAIVAFSVPFREAIADVKLPAIFSDHVVLQRDMPLPVWGWADPNEIVKVSIAGQSHSATSNDKGKWKVTLGPLSVGPPLKLIVQGANRVVVDDVLVGEVWLCAGQSNMQLNVQSCLDADMQIPSAKYPQIRFITVTGQGSQTPVEGFSGHWQTCSPETVRDFSAVGYYFGRELHQHMDVPIGLIDNSWSASSCEAWIRRELLEENPRFQSLLIRISIEICAFCIGGAADGLDSLFV